MRAYFLLLILALSYAQAAERLPPLGAKATEVTVSGLSSGAYMAVQFQVAHSELVSGAGAIAGGPYECAEMSLSRAMKNCMNPDSRTWPPTAEHTQSRVDARARTGLIDPPAGLRNDRVWVLSGGSDNVVERPVVDALVAFYRLHLPEAAIRYVEHPEAGHAMISATNALAQGCKSSEPPFINFCDGFDAPGELLAHLLGPLSPRGTAQGRLITFDQQPFIKGKAVDSSLADEGYVYVPRECESGGCRVHVVFHGCLQTGAQIGTRFVQGSGYNEWADTNRIIMLYPQVRPRWGVAWGSTRWVLNPRGCWDWWGYTGAGYATRNGAQVRAVRAMVERLMQ